MLKGTLPFTLVALGLIIMTEQALLKRNSTMQKLPRFDPCKHLDQRMVIMKRYCTFHKLKTLDREKMVKNEKIRSFYDPARSKVEKSDKKIITSDSMNHLDVSGKPVTVHNNGFKSNVEASKTIGRQSGAGYFKQYFKYFKQDQDQDEDQGEDEDPDEKLWWTRIMKKMWWKKMMKRAG